MTLPPPLVVGVLFVEAAVGVLVVADDPTDEEPPPVLPLLPYVQL